MLLFTGIAAKLEVLYCMHKFNLEASVLPEVAKMLNLTSAIFILIESIERSKIGNIVSSNG